MDLTRLAGDDDDDAAGAYFDALKKRLEALDISQGAVAREMGVQASAFSRWMRGHVEPKLTTVMRIERAIAAINMRRLKSKPKPAQAKRRPKKK